MGQVIDITGQVFGRLTVVAFSHIDGQARWLCRCSCTSTVTIAGNDLRSGHSQSCGCLKAEKTRTRRRTHGRSTSPTYRTWSRIKMRCHSPNHPDFKDYGGRGIKVCKRWHKFENFLADMGEKPVNKTIDRIDNNGDYCLVNCRWATSIEQANNKRTVPLYTYNGENLSIAEIARRCGVKRVTLRKRITKLGWSIDRATAERRTL